MVGSKHASLNYLNLIDFMPELWYYTGVFIRHNISGCFKMALNVLKKQFCKFNCSRSFTRGNKQHVLGHTVYNYKYAVILHAIPHENRQSSNSVQANLFERCHIWRNRQQFQLAVRLILMDCFPLIDQIDCNIFTNIFGNFRLGKASLYKIQGLILSSMITWWAVMIDL